MTDLGRKILGLCKGYPHMSFVELIQNRQA